MSSNSHSNSFVAKSLFIHIVIQSILWWFDECVVAIIILVALECAQKCYFFNNNSKLFRFQWAMHLSLITFTFFDAHKRSYHYVYIEVHRRFESSCNLRDSTTRRLLLLSDDNRARAKKKKGNNNVKIPFSFVIFRCFVRFFCFYYWVWRYLFPILAGSKR